jgi:hypothetical protein
VKFVVNGVKYEFAQKKMTFAEAKAIQKVTKKTFGQVADAAEQGDFEAMQAFVWVAMKKDDPTLKFSDLDDLELGEFEMIPDPDDEEETEADPPVLGDESEETLTPSG